MRTVLVDAGPLIAFFNDGDEHHAWATEQFLRLKRPLATCEPVLAEVAHHVGRAGGDAALLMDWVEAGVLRIEFGLAREAAAIATLMRRYADQPMDLADACLVRMAETVEDAQVFTVDRDFLVYRRHGRQPMPLLAPFA